MSRTPEENHNQMPLQNQETPISYNPLPPTDKPEKLAESNARVRNKLSRRDQIMRSLSAASDHVVEVRKKNLDRRGRVWVQDEDLRSLTGATINSINSVGQGTARVASDIATLPNNAEASKYLSRIPDDARLALEKVMQRQPISKREEAALDQEIDMNDPETKGQFYVPTDKQNLMTPRQIYTKHLEELNAAKSTKDYLTKDTFLTKGFNELNRERVMTDLDGIWDDIENPISDERGNFDTAKLYAKATGKTLLALLDNPAASFEYAAENLPNVLLTRNPVTAALDTAAYAADIVGSDKLRDNEEGKIDSKEKSKEQFIEALAAAGLEYGSNLAIASASGLKTVMRSSKNKPKPKAPVRTLKDLGKATAGRTAKATGSTLGEGVTEGIQTAVENDAFGDDFDFNEDARDIYKGAAIGIGASAATTSPNQALQLTKDTAKVALSSAEKKAEEDSPEVLKKKKEQANKEIDELLVDNDFSKFVTKSMNTSGKSDEIDLTTKVSTIAARHESEVKAENPDNKKADAISLAFFQVAGEISSKRAELIKEGKETQDKTRKAEISKEIDALKKADKEVERLTPIILANEQSQTKTSEAVDEVVKSEKRDGKFTINAQRIIKSSLVDPESITQEQMEQLLKSDKWTPEERAHLSTIALAKNKRIEALDSGVQKSWEKVRGEVIRGSKENIGADQYRQEIGVAVRSGNTAKAELLRTKLANFATRHQAKFEAFSKAYAPFLRDGGKTITPEEQASIDAVAKDYKGFEISGASGRIVDSIGKEAESLQATLSEVDTLIETGGDIISPDIPASNDATVETSSTDTAQAVDVNTNTETPTVSQQQEQPVEAPVATQSNEPVTPVQEQVETPKADTKTEERPEPVKETANQDVADVRASLTKAGTKEERTEVSRKLKTLDDSNLSEADAEVLAGVQEEASEKGLYDIGSIFEPENIDNPEAPVQSVNLDETQFVDANVNFIADVSSTNTEDTVTDITYGEDGKANIEVTRANNPDQANLFSDTQEQKPEQNVQPETDPKPVSTLERLFSLRPDSIFNKWFTAGKPKSPMGKFPNLISIIKESPSKLVEMLKLDAPLTTEQTKALNTFVAFHEGFSKVLDNILDQSTDDTLKYNMQGYLSKDGKLLDGVKQAMSLAAYNWFTLDAPGTVQKDKKTVGKLFGLKPEQVSNDLVYNMSRKGDTDKSIASRLGADITRTLGIKYNPTKANEETLAQLESQIGAHVLGAMSETKMITVTKESVVDIRDWIGDIKGNIFNHVTNPNITLNFIRANVNYDALYTDKMYTPRLQTIIDNNKNSKRIVSKLGETTSNNFFPRTTASEDTPKKQKNTIRTLASKIKDILAKNQAKPWKLVNTIDKVFSDLPKEMQLEMAGYKSDAELELMPFDMRESARSKNDSIRRDVELYEEFRSLLSDKKDGLDTAFYFDYEVAKNQRSHMKGIVGPQDSKLHRGLMGLASWRQRIDRTNKEQDNQFLMGVAQGLGVKVDKKAVKTSLEAFNALIKANPILVEAAQQIHAVNLGLQDVESIADTLVKAVAIGKEGTHSLLALGNYGAYLAAGEKGAFESTMWTEIDGITNGVVIGILQFGNGSAEFMKSMLRKGGVFFGKERSYGEIKDAEGKEFTDFYETLRDNWSSALKNKVNSLKKGSLDHKRMIVLQIIFGPIDRDLAKAPTMNNVYGSGGSALKKLLEDRFFEEVDKKINKIFKENASNDTRLEKLTELERFLRLITNGKPVLNITDKASDVLQKPVPTRTKTYMGKVIGELYGKPMLEGVDQMFSNFKQNRQVYNNSLQQLNKVFVGLYKEMVEKRKEFLVEKGAMGKDDPLPQMEMDNLLASLHDFIPSVKTLFSDKASEQLQVTKKIKEAIQGKTLDTKFSRKLAAFNSKTIKGKLVTPSFQSDLGVAGAIQNIHSIDATIALMIMDSLDVLNVFDGFPVASLEAKAAGKTLNEQFLDVSKKRDVYGELSNALEKAMYALTKISENTGISTKQYENKLKAANDDIRLLIDTTRNTKKEVINSITHVDQYFHDGGGFTVPEDAEKMKLSKTVTPPAAVPTTKEIPTSPWGKLTRYPTKDVFSNKLNSILRDTDNAVEVLKRLFKDSNPEGLHETLLHKLTDSIDKNLKIKLIDGNSPFNEDIGILKEANGIYVGETHTVYLKSTDFIKNGVNKETFAHELIHGATAHMIKRVRDGEEVSPKAVEAVRQLADMRRQVIAQLKNNNLTEKTKNALENVDEFVAYGLTDLQFQKTLGNTRVNVSGKVKSAIKGFVSAINQLVFKRRSVASDNTLGQLIHATAVVIEQQRIDNKRPASFSDDSIRLQRIERMSSMDILSELDPGKRSTEHTNHLQEIQSKLVNSIAGVEGAELFEAEENLGDEVDQYLNHLLKGTNPFISRIGDLFSLTKQETFVIEQLEATIGSEFLKPHMDVNRLSKLWQQAKDALTPTDLLDHPSEVNNPDAMKRAEARYKLLFNPTMTDVTVEMDSDSGKEVTKATSDYLQRFAIMSSVHEPLRKVLASKELKEEDTSKSSYAKAIAASMDNVMDVIRSAATGAKRPTGNLGNQLEAVLNNLAQVTRKERTKLVDKPDPIDTKTEKLDKFLSDSIKKGLNSVSMSGLKNSNIPVVKTLATAAGVVAREQVGAVMDTMNRFRSEEGKTQDGFMAKIMTEMRNITPNNHTLVKLLRWVNRDNEQRRRKVKEWLKKGIEDSFIKELTEKQEIALTKALIETDAITLMQSFTLSQIEEMLSDPLKLKREIRKSENELKDTKYGQYYINQSDALGFYMTTGRGSNNFLSKNAHNIANLYGFTDQPSDVDVQLATPVIDRLASLHAMSYLDADIAQETLEVIRSEREREDGKNGIEYVLFQHGALKEEALQRNFSSDPSLMTKGHTYEITNHNLSVRWAKAGSPEAAELVKQGYKDRYNTSRDSALDPESTQSVMFVSENGGLSRYVSGVVSMTNKSTKGKRFSESAKEVGNDGAALTHYGDLKKMKAKAKNNSAALFNKRVYPRDTKGNKLIPVFSPTGEITDYTYEMSKQVRDKVLQKRNNLGDVMGGMAGNIVDKASTESMNNQTVQALYDQFTDDPFKTRSSYIEVSADSKDPEIRQMWNMLPYGAKQKALATFGKPHIMVKRELLDLVFGYREASVRDLWDKDKELIMWQKALKFTLENTFGLVVGEKLALRLYQVENAHQELIRMVKDIFVVKNIFTTVGNIVSNAALLSMAGVPFKDIVVDQMGAWRNAQAYTSQEKEVYLLQRDLEALPITPSNQNKRDSIIGRINELNHKMNTNPVHELMQAGMFQTIVEDIDVTKDPFSYKTKFMKKVDEMVGDKVPKTAKTFGKYLFVTQDTELYKMMNNPIQLSDFAARYTQYKYLTKTKASPLSKEDAIDRITENFINYDIPTNKSLHYLNSVGLMMFTKYMLRIQKPVLNLFMEKPATSILNIMAQGTFGFSNPIDSSFLTSDVTNRMYEPFSTMFGAIDEIAPLNAVLHTTGLK